MPGKGTHQYLVPSDIRLAKEHSDPLRVCLLIAPYNMLLLNALYAIGSRLATSPASVSIALCVLGRKTSPTTITVVFTRVTKANPTGLYGEPSHREEMSLLISQPCKF
jgi:hypothetical protein